MNDWTCALMNKSSVAVAFIHVDFQKAFDSVCHNKLFCKLKTMGFDGNLLKWMENFFCGRWQRTRVGNYFSEPVSIISGIIQGSCIGPLLFLLYIHCVTTIIDNKIICVLFADNIKLYAVIKCHSDLNNLQNSLDRILDWSNKHQLPISVRKCSCIVLGNISVDNVHYSIGKQPVNIVSEVCDLGVIVDPAVKFNSHINYIVAKANTRTSLIHKCFLSHNPKVMLRAFKVYVRPILEYATSVWSPYFNCAIDKIESVQRKFTKMLKGCKYMDYPARLIRLLSKLRRLRKPTADLILT